MLRKYKGKIIIHIIRIVCNAILFFIILLLASQKEFIENENMLKVITSMSFVLGIWQISDIFFPNIDPDIEEIKKQNEEMKAELEEIKNMIAEQPKQYKVDIKMIE